MPKLETFFVREKFPVVSLDNVLNDMRETTTAPWPTAILYQPHELEQILMHENASCLAVRTFLTMYRLPFTIQIRSNAEFMANNGRLSRLPLLHAKPHVLAEFEPIVTYSVKAITHNLIDDKNDSDTKDDMWAFVTWAENTFTMGELYVIFMDKQVYNEITIPRISCAFPWPLNRLQVYAKRRHALRLLRAYQWHDLTADNVRKNVQECCEALVKKLTETGTPYFGGEQPCELDAMVFGHLFTILTTDLPNKLLIETILSFAPLVEFCYFIEKRFFPS